MGLRITTWNVNGIRNPFGYQPWRENKTYHAMFDTLDADIVVMQETKIQRKDLQDDMVLVPGWDVFFSLPKHKKGYSGVAIYTRNAKCCPIRAEEGITGVLCPPNTTTPFRHLPAAQQIGGYPRPDQFAVDDTLLDSEGRCVVLEFPCFVLLGVYCPATRDATRIEFRQAFLDALDARVRNLAALGKQVVLCGDLNIIRCGLDTAGMQEALRREGMTYVDFISMPSRRFFNHLIFGGQVFGERDAGREQPVLWDLCREFHRMRQGMYTCWETRKNARPGNFGSRIDYVLCTSGIKEWFVASNIQEGLLGSDHCPVYATLADAVAWEGKTVAVLDVMNPKGMFQDGRRLRAWSPDDILPLSAKRLPEFDRRRTIRDMFGKTSTAEAETSNPASHPAVEVAASHPASDPASHPASVPASTASTSRKRAHAPATSSTQPPKKSKGAAASKAGVRGPPSQRSLMGFFKPTAAAGERSRDTHEAEGVRGPPASQRSLMGLFKFPAATSESDQEATSDEERNSGTEGKDSTQSGFVSPAPSRSRMLYAASPSEAAPSNASESIPEDRIIDPIVSKESWSQLLGKRIVPRCEHEDDCQLLVTKKPGMNRGRAFYMCPRPLGPSGDKESGTEFRCRTFIWSSDWNGRQ